MKREIIQQLNQAILTTEATRKRDYQKIGPSLLATNELMLKSNNLLLQLQKYCSTDDFEYEQIADKLALELLNGTIDYYNETADIDAAQHVRAVLHYAEAIVVGRDARARIAGALNVLPPPEAFEDDKKIRDALNDFLDSSEGTQGSITFCKRCKPVLDNIARKVGRSNAYYLKTSTTVAECALIESQAHYNLQLQMGGGRISSDSIAEVWALMRIIDTFDLTPEFRNGRFARNRAIIQRTKQRGNKRRLGCFITLAVIALIIYWIAS